MGAVLAGWLLAAAIARGRHTALTVAVLAMYCGILVHEAAQPPVADSHASLAVWLREHDLRGGLAGYWNASVVTVISGDAVSVRPLAVTPGGAAPLLAESDSAWYDAGRNTASFLVISTPHGTLSAGALAFLAAAENTPGHPVAAHQ